MYCQITRIGRAHPPRFPTDSITAASNSPAGADTVMPTIATTNVTELEIDTTITAKTSVPRVAIIASSVGGGVMVLALGLLFVWLWRTRRKRRRREARAWTVERVSGPAESSRRLNGQGASQISEFDESASPQTPISASSIPDTPPQIPLTPGWPRTPITEKEENGWQSANEKRREGRRTRSGARVSRLMDDTPFENIVVEEGGESSGEAGRVNGRQTPSLLEAENGSVGHSTAPSRAASQRTRSSIRKVLRMSALTPTSWRRPNRTRAAATTHPGTNDPTAGTADQTTRNDRHRSVVSSLWSWSHRATRSEYDADGEPLPAYTLRRSQSTTRSGARSGRSSMMRLSTLPPDANPPDYPVELGRKVAQTYPRMPGSPGFPPPSFDGQDTNSASLSQ